MLPKRSMRRMLLCTNFRFSFLSGCFFFFFLVLRQLPAMSSTENSYIVTNLAKQMLLQHAEALFPGHIGLSQHVEI